MSSQPQDPAVPAPSPVSPDLAPVPASPLVPAAPRPLSDKTRKARRRGKIFTLIGVAALVGAFTGAIGFAIIYASPVASIQQLQQGANLAVILAPIAVAALGIERLIEMMWNLIESYIRSVVAFLAGRSEWLRWANDELSAARERLEELAHDGDPTERVADMLPTSQDALSQLIQRAADDVAFAEARLSSLTSTGQYRDAKRVISILTSLWLGIVIATVTNLQMFALLGIRVDPRIDVIITGIAIGTGSTPVHSLIGILQQGKDTLDGVQNLLKTRNVQATQDLTNQST